MSRDTQFLRKADPTTVSLGTLPADITDLVLRRVVILCLISAAMVALGSVICIGNFLMEGVLIQGMKLTPIESTNELIMILVALSVAWVVHRRLLSSRALISLGFGFGVYVSLYYVVGECYSLINEPFEPIAFFSFNQAWVVFFPAIIPVRSRTASLMIVLAAALTPLGRMVVQSAGWVELPENSLAIISILMMFSAIMGLAVSHVVYKLGRSIKAAREMGSYTLEKSLGGGGMGEVWVASHRLLARPAAVKLIKQEVLAGMNLEEVARLNRRFEQEVQATAALCSPHTVDIYDYGLAQDGTFYYVMELLDGIDMETLVRKYGPVEPSRAVHLLVQACHSLGEAHRRQLIHRDIKPANLFICRYGDDLDFVKVLDFGLVKREQSEKEPDLNLTVEGSITGTPAYLYPEAVSGKNPVDSRSDIYSLGCVAYWLLTGQLVFTAETHMAMMVEHATAEPIPPSRRSEMEIPAELDNVILACLAKNPADRPRSAADLARRLREIDLPHPWDPDRAQAWWDLHH